MVLRPYLPSEFEALWRLDQECFAPGIAYSREELQAFLSRRTAEVAVVDDDGRVVAFVIGSRRRGEGYVITLDVAAAARRRGLGRILMEHLEARFHALGVRRVRLEAAIDNASAIAFYERLGYRTVDRKHDYYGPGLDAWSMEKRLTESVSP